MKVEELMMRDIIAAKETDSLNTAMKLMKENSIKHLPIVNKDNKLVGIVTDRDIKRASASDATMLEVHEMLYLLDKVTLAQVMTRNPVSGSPVMTMQEAAATMVKNKIGCLPVTIGGKLEGMLTVTDFLKFLANQ
ncbi:MAG: CBS domain-containing protein [Candidatus Lambdaproteobacteria bacterium]|nr:CBS domain-containing protein [Candidatus Lambdaproteobacteria bacterium]